MAKKQTGTVTLTLTPEEADLVERALYGAIARFEKAIETGEVHPDSDILTSAAQEAREILPMANALAGRIVRICMDARLSSRPEGRPQ